MKTTPIAIATCGLLAGSLLTNIYRETTIPTDRRFYPHASGDRVNSVYESNRTSGQTWRIRGDDVTPLASTNKANQEETLAALPAPFASVQGVEPESSKYSLLDEKSLATKLQALGFDAKKVEKEDSWEDEAIPVIDKTAIVKQPEPEDNSWRDEAIPVRVATQRREAYIRGLVEHERAQEQEPISNISDWEEGTRPITQTDLRREAEQLGRVKHVRQHAGTVFARYARNVWRSIASDLAAPLATLFGDPELAEEIMLQEAARSQVLAERNVQKPDYSYLFSSSTSSVTNATNVSHKQQLETGKSDEPASSLAASNIPVNDTQVDHAFSNDRVASSAARKDALASKTATGKLQTDSSMRFEINGTKVQLQVPSGFVRINDPQFLSEIPNPANYTQYGAFHDQAGGLVLIHSNPAMDRHPLTAHMFEKVVEMMTPEALDEFKPRTMEQINAWLHEQSDGPSLATMTILNLDKFSDVFVITGLSKLSSGEVKVSVSALKHVKNRALAIGVSKPYEAEPDISWATNTAKLFAERVGSQN